MQAFTDKAAKIGDNATADILNNSFSLMEGEFPETPTLIYDGPFSSHISGLKPKYLEGKNEVPQDKAMEIALSFMGIDKGVLQADGARAGSLPVYTFYANTDGGTVSIEVTKQGGIVASAFNSRVVRNSVMAPEDAVKIAGGFWKRPVIKI
jgi:hypothetical protein